MDEETKEKLYEIVRQSNNYGFMIPDLKLSVPLYRYRSNIEFAIDEIENDYIYLSPANILNDPFDSSCKITFEEALLEVRPAISYWYGCFFFKNKIWYDEINNLFIQSDLGQKRITMKDFFLFVEKEVRERGGYFPAEEASKAYYSSMYNRIHRRTHGNVACFSEIGDSIIMWSYYANSHQGVCLKYEPQLLDTSNIEYEAILKSIRKVWYSNIRFEDKEGKFSPFLKSEEWSHEREWRMFRNINETNKIQFPCLTAVYLGTNFDFENKNVERIISAISNKKRKIELYHYWPSPQEFLLKAKRINY